MTRRYPACISGRDAPYIGQALLMPGRAGGEGNPQPPHHHFIAAINATPGDTPSPNRDPFEMTKFIHVKATLPDEDEKQVEAAKTARLRAFRLAKEASDRAAASREVAAAPPKNRRRHPLDHPGSRAS